MQITISQTTKDILSTYLGKKAEFILARRYPGYLAYSEVAVGFGEDALLRIFLKSVDVGPKFEVSLVQVEPMPSMDDIGCDKLVLYDFKLSEVHIVRRKEWIEPSSGQDAAVGLHAVMQKFGSLDDASAPESAVEVDVGFQMKSAGGAIVLIQADTFPLVMQLNYSVSASGLPRGVLVPIEAGRKSE